MPGQGARRANREGHMSVHTITTEEDFQNVFSANDTLVLDFWAPWCAPCKGFAPVFESVASQNSDMAFCRINTEEAKELKEAFEISSIPTLMIIRDKVLVASHAGYMDKEALAGVVDQVRGLDMDEVRKQEQNGSA